MKNKLSKIFFYFLIITSFFLKNSYSEEFEFTATDLEILNDGTLLIGNDDVKIISNNQIIKAKKFRYNKNNLHLELMGNVEIINKLDNTIINADKIDYFKKEEKIITDGDVVIKIKDKYIINSSDLTYLLIKKHFFSKKKTTLKDNMGNEFELKDFNYFRLKNNIRGKKLVFKDTEANKYFIDDAFINLENNEILGKDIKINFLNSTFGNTSNEPRLKGNKIYHNENLTTISKGVFTTCKKTDKCPPWTMQAMEVEHDKKKKIISYKNAWLKIYDTPVMYFPKFFHPDPTVKRQSGFLIPKLSDSNTLGSTLSIPYFKVIAENKDVTIKPRLYDKGGLLIQSEYRERKEKSSHIFDFSILNMKNLNFFGKENRKSHFFSNSVFNYDFHKFQNSKIELNIETTSNDTYLKTYKIKSPIITNQTSLNSFIDLELNNEKTYLKTSFQSFENLNKTKAERYEYIYPNVEFLKQIDLNPNNKGTLSFDLNGYQKKYNSNSYDTVLINNLEYESTDYIVKNGLKNKFNLLLKNVNTNGDNSSSFKNDSSNKILGSFIFKSGFPLKKQGLNFDSYLKPQASFRYSPNETKNMTDNDRRIDINNIFSNNRIGENSAVEGGQSLTLGTEYKLSDKENTNEYFLLNLATVLRDEKNPDLPTKSTIGEKTSNIMGNAKFKPNDIFNIDYKFSLDNNLDTSNYDSIKSTLSVNNFVTSFDFLQEQNVIGNESYIGNTTSYKFDESNSLTFSTRKNKKTDLTEFYNLMYSYKNDCLTAAIEYNKEYYNDQDLRPEEQLLFTLTIVPFGRINSPNLSQ